MSIMLPAEEQEVAGAHGIEPKLRALLDHVAAELAQEYIRLMEAAASEETAGRLLVADA